MLFREIFIEIINLFKFIKTMYFDTTKEMGDPDGLKYFKFASVFMNNICNSPRALISSQFLSLFFFFVMGLITVLNPCSIKKLETASVS